MSLPSKLCSVLLNTAIHMVNVCQRVGAAIPFTIRLDNTLDPRDQGWTHRWTRRSPINLLPLQRGLINEPLRHVDVFMHSLMHLTLEMMPANVRAKVCILRDVLPNLSYRLLTIYLTRRVRLYIHILMLLQTDEVKLLLYSIIPGGGV